ncbi:MAG: hypothetical protein AAGB01_02575 [Cyanobacteria bacterium P01_F01_bin.42]
MSAVKKFFGAIVSFITGLVGTVLGIFGKKDKKDESSSGAKQSENDAASIEVATAGADGAGAEAAAEEATLAQGPVDVETLIQQALNKPKPEPEAAEPEPVAVATIEPLNIPKFGPPRRPGSNMQSFLDMAKTYK